MGHLDAPWLLLVFVAGYFYFWAHTPYQCDSYDHFDESYLYQYVKGNLEKSGQLDENLRVKVRHFYPQTAEE